MNALSVIPQCQRTDPNQRKSLTVLILSSSTTSGKSVPKDQVAVDQWGTSTSVLGHFGPQSLRS